MDFWNSLRGTVSVEVTSADPAAVLQKVAESGIVLWNVDFSGDLTLRCEIQRQDYRKIQKLISKRGDKLRLRRRSGWYWSAKSLINRPVLLAGLLILLLLILFMPTRVLFVQVVGNTSVPTHRIQAAAEDCGIRFWASRRTVRSEKVKNALLGALPELTWAGVNTKGCVAVISVQERSETMEKTVQKHFGSIVAAREGVIESCTALEGNMLCHVGQAVKTGDVLISGYTDCGICIRVSRADGEVFARTRHKIDGITLSEATLQGEIQDVKHQYSLLVGKKRINLWKDSGIWHGSCDRMYEEYYITLPGGFTLPVAFVRETFLFRETKSAKIESAVLQDMLKTHGRSYLLQHMVAGRILSGSEVFRCGEDFCRMEGIYLCSEMIGRVQTEKIGE